MGHVAHAVASFNEFRRYQDGCWLDSGWIGIEVMGGFVGSGCLSGGNQAVLESFARWGGSSAGRASRSQCEGREFDPPLLHHEFRISLTGKAILHETSSVVAWVSRMDVPIETGEWPSAFPHIFIEIATAPCIFGWPSR